MGKAGKMRRSVHADDVLDRKRERGMKEKRRERDVGLISHQLLVISIRTVISIDREQAKGTPSLTKVSI